MKWFVAASTVLALLVAVLRPGHHPRSIHAHRKGYRHE